MPSGVPDVGLQQQQHGARIFFLLTKMMTRESLLLLLQQYAGFCQEVLPMSSCDFPSYWLEYACSQSLVVVGGAAQCPHMPVPVVYDWVYDF
jgi:hypothetical protein